MGETGETSYETFLEPGDYDIYVAAYDEKGKLIITTKPKNVQIEDVNVKFKDEKYETYMVSNYDLNEDGKIQIQIETGIYSGKEGSTEHSQL